MQSGEITLYMGLKAELERQAAMSQLYVSVDRRWYRLTSYVIDGNNYFKLRDLGRILDFGVGFDETTGTVLIDTDAGYMG